MGLLAVPFIRNALAAGVLVALGLSPLGVYVVLRRVVFVGAAAAEVCSAGVALAVLLNFEPFAAALILTVLTFVGFSLAAESPRLPLEAVVGMLYAGGAAAAILLIAKAPRGEGSIVNILFGNILTVAEPLLWTMGVVFAVVLAVQYLFSKEFLIAAYDPDMARVLGIRAGLWNGIFYVTLGVAVAVAIRGVGALLSFTLLVAPAAAALVVARSLRGAFTIAAVVGLGCTMLGSFASYWLDTPTGPTIVAVLAVPFVLTYFYAAISGQ